MEERGLLLPRHNLLNDLFLVLGHPAQLRLTCDPISSHGNPDHARVVSVSDLNFGQWEWQAVGENFGTEFTSFENSQNVYNV